MNNLIYNNYFSFKFLSNYLLGECFRLEFYVSDS